MVTLKEVSELLENGSRRQISVMQYLGKKAPYMMALQSEIGVNLLKYKISKMQVLFEKWLNGEATEEDRLDMKNIRKELDHDAEEVRKFLEAEAKIYSEKQNGR